MASNPKYSRQNRHTRVCRDIEKKIFAAEKARAKLLTWLNVSNKLSNEYNKTYTEFLFKIEFNYDFAITVNFKALNDLQKGILECEWKKVKEESRGNID